MSTNGITQGCPLSVVLLNILVSAWTNSVKSEVRLADPCGYVDDTGMTSSSSSTLQQTLELTGNFASITGQVLNAKKNQSWTTESSREGDL